MKFIKNDIEQKTYICTLVSNNKGQLYITFQQHYYLCNLFPSHPFNTNMYLELYLTFIKMLLLGSYTLAEHPTKIWYSSKFSILKRIIKRGLHIKCLLMWEFLVKGTHFESW